MTGEPLDGSGQREHRRSARDRRRLLDPFLEADRKVKTRSFVPIVAHIFHVLSDNARYMGRYLAEKCRVGWSRGSVWNHLHWLERKGIIKQVYDGQRSWFHLDQAMSQEAKYYYEGILPCCRQYWQQRYRAPTRNAPRLR